MQTGDESSHDREIINQFTQQAIPFTQLPGHLDSIEMLIELCEVTPSDTVLDVACGPGLVACKFAGIAKEVTFGAGMLQAAVIGIIGGVIGWGLFILLGTLILSAAQ